MSENRISPADAIRIARTARGLSQPQLAAVAGVSRDQVSQMELGRLPRYPHRAPAFNRVLDALDRTPPLPDPTPVLAALRRSTRDQDDLAYPNQSTQDRRRR